MRIKSKAILLATASMIAFSSMAMADGDLKRIASRSAFESHRIDNGIQLAMLQEEDHDHDDHDDHDDHNDHDEHAEDDHEDHEDQDEHADKEQ